MTIILKEWFGVSKPVIAMAHFPALPGTPRYDKQLGLDRLIGRMERDGKALLNGGVDSNITPEFTSPLGSRSLAQRARSAVVSSLVDAILIAGPMVGAEPDFKMVKEAKEAVGGDIPLLLNTGAQVDNIHKYLQVADGVIVGSSLKKDGYTWNPVDLSG